MPSGPLQGMHEFFEELSRTCQHGISAMSGEGIPAPGALTSPRRTSPGHLLFPCLVTAGHRDPQDEVGADCAIEAKGG